MRVAGSLDRWQWLSDWFSEHLQIDKKRFKSMVSDGSVRVNKALVLEDVYVGPGSIVLTYLEPKVYNAPVTVIKHAASSLKRVEEWKPKWNLVRKATRNWMLVDKPSGISSIATRDFARGTLVPFWLRKHIPRQLGSGGILTTSRLDVGTHGLIVVGRNSRYVGKHNDLIESRNVRKHYTAVVTGWHRPHIRRYPSKTKITEVSEPQWLAPSAGAEPFDTHDPLVELNGKQFKFPWRHTGLWEHFIPQRGAGEKEIPDPSYGTIFRNSTRLGDWEHLRVISSREKSPNCKVPVKLIVEHAREATADSVALRAFPQRWRERLVDQAKLYGEPLYEIDIELLTGKTHQIRTQLECEGLVIIGDWLYGSPYLPDPNSFALCCRKLEWTCPSEKTEIAFDLRSDPLTTL